MKLSLYFDWQFVLASTILKVRIDFDTLRERLTKGGIQMNRLTTSQFKIKLMALSDAELLECDAILFNKLFTKEYTDTVGLKLDLIEREIKWRSMSEEDKRAKLHIIGGV